MMGLSYGMVALMAVALYISAMALIGLVLFRQIDRWGRSIDKRMMEIGEGQDQIPSPEEGIIGSDEIGDLVRAFDRMEKALTRHIRDIALMTAEKEKAKAELDVATRIQADMLPDDFTIFGDKSLCDIYGSMSPAKEVGGDFYDFFALDGDRICIVIADVSGKGVPGALFMAISKVLIKQRAVTGGSPSQILSDVNRQLCAENKEMLFVTVWLGIIDRKTRTLEYCNAGHEYPVVIRGGKPELIKDGVNNPPLAVAEGYPFVDKTLQLGSGDSIFVYTDGIPEAKNVAGDRYGLDRMLRVLESSENKSVSEVASETPCRDVINMMVEDMTAFVATGDPFDDVTMLLLRIG